MSNRNFLVALIVILLCVSGYGYMSKTGKLDGGGSKKHQDKMQEKEWPDMPETGKQRLPSPPAPGGMDNGDGNLPNPGDDDMSPGGSGGGPPPPMPPQPRNRRFLRNNNDMSQGSWPQAPPPPQQ